jgi:endoglucanase
VCTYNLPAQLYPAGVAYSPMRGLNNHQFVKNMLAGWNLGNTMDASPGETGWGNPVTTQAMIDTVAKAGFRTLREPVTWQGHFGAAPTYTIDTVWMDRVATIAGYGLNDSMYVIINTHHDGWYNLGATGATITSIKAEVVAIWTQIANKFKNYGDYVIFEIFNEPNAGATNQYNGGSAANRAVLDTYQIAAVNAIRATGGNNATRKIMLQGISASPIAVSVGTIPIIDSNCIVSIHTYYPQGFSMNCNPKTWGTTADSANVRSALAGEQTMVANKGGVAVVGEWASEACDQTPSRAAHAYYYAQQVRSVAMVPVWWDDGGVAAGSNGFGLLNRTTGTWAYPTIAAALVAGAKSANYPTSILDEAVPEKNASSGLQERAGVVHYTLAGSAPVTLRLYSVQGRLVSTLVNARQHAGAWAVKVPAGISGGHYLLELKAGNSSVMKGINIFR